MSSRRTVIAARLAARRYGREPRRGAPTGARVAVLSPAPKGSFGDEAMLLAATAALEERGMEPLVIDVRTGSSYRPAYGSPRGVAQRTDSAAAVLMIGADVLDGAYGPVVPTSGLRLLRRAKAQGANAAVVGFSWRDNAPAWACRSLRLADREGVMVVPRDARSAARVSDVLGRTVQPAADLAILLPASASPATATCEAFVAEEHRAGRRVFGLNLSSYLTTSRRSARLDSWADVVVKGVGEGVSWVIVPHDDRGSWTDRLAGDELVARLPPDVRRRVAVADVTGPTEAKAVVASLDGLMTERLHLGIGALSSAVPAAVANYQGKVEGVFELFGMPEELMIGASSEGDDVALGYRTLANQSPALRQELSRQAASARQLALQNLVPVIPVGIGT